MFLPKGYKYVKKSYIWNSITYTELVQRRIWWKYSTLSAKNSVFYTTQLNGTNDFIFMSLWKQERIKLVYNIYFKGLRLNSQIYDSLTS